MTTCTSQIEFTTFLSRQKQIERPRTKKIVMSFIRLKIMIAVKMRAIQAF
jgi:hypothetical protein